MLFHQLFDLYKSYHLTGAPFQQLYSQILSVSNKMWVHQLHVQMRCSLTMWYLILVKTESVQDNAILEFGLT